MTSPSSCNVRNSWLLGRFQRGNEQSLLASKVDHTPLPVDYRPTDYDVQCGRGRGYYDCPGNCKFRELVRNHVPRYLAQTSKAGKTAVLSEVVIATRQQDFGRAKFVKLTGNGQWSELGDGPSREKACNAMREAVAAFKKEQKTIKAGSSLPKQQQHEPLPLPVTSANPDDVEMREVMPDSLVRSSLNSSQQHHHQNKKSNNNNDQNAAERGGKCLPQPPPQQVFGLRVALLTPSEEKYCDTELSLMSLENLSQDIPQSENGQKDDAEFTGDDSMTDHSAFHDMGNSAEVLMKCT